MSLSLWTEFQCSLLGSCGCQCNCHAIHLSTMAEFKMADFKMAAMCELSQVILTLSLCPFCVLLGKCWVLMDGGNGFSRDIP